MGLIKYLYKTATAPLRKLMKILASKFGKKSEENPDVTEIPQKWVKTKGIPKKGVKRNTQLEIKKGKIIVTRKIHHWPWLRNLKRGIAAILLMVNLAFSQFVLASQSQGQPLFIFFVFNSFILADYLWKTRRKIE